MPPIRSRSAPPRRRAPRLLLIAGLVVAPLETALAQATDLGPAPAADTSLRGTTEATGIDRKRNDPVDTDAASPTTTGVGDATLPPAEPVTSNKATLAPGTKAQLTLPKLRNRALPEHYPVPMQTLQPYPTAFRRKGNGVTDADLNGINVPNTTTAALPVDARRTIRPDDNPFAPVGYDVGGLRLFPYVEQSIGYDSNPDQVSKKVKGSAYSRTEGGFTMQSDWSAHSLTGTMHGAYDDFFSTPSANRPDANGVVDLRIDATRDTKLDAEGRFDITTQRPGSPELNVAVRDRPLITSFGGTVGVTQAFGRFSVGLHGLIDRSEFEDGVLTNGHPVALAYENFTDYGVKARVGYDLKPGLQPFAEIGVDQRRHDQTVDIAGFRRDSDGIGGRIGSTFEFWPQLTGTASVGYANRSYDDRRLRDLRGPTADGTLVWAVTPLTAVTLNGATSFNETTVSGASGIESRLIGLAVSHAFFRYLTLTAAVSYQRDQYRGAPITENTLTESLKGEYHLSRSLVLTGTLSHQRLRSTSEGSDYTQNIALIGLRLQH